jgi:DNA-binding MarR family transcriptional regulator
MAWSAASHHLHGLEKNGYTRTESHGAAVAFYPTKRALDDESYALIDEDQQVLDAVKASPGFLADELAAKLNRHPASVGRNVERLQRLGYLERTEATDEGRLFARRMREP